MCSSRQLLIALLIVILIFIAYRGYAMRRLVGRLAKCGWTVYYLDGCGYCTKQKHGLPGFKNYTEYDSTGAVKAGYTAAPEVAFSAISAFPYWYNTITKQSKEGYLTAAELGHLSC